MRGLCADGTLRGEPRLGQEAAWRPDAADARSGRASGRLPVPWQEVVELRGRGSGDAGKDVGEPGLGVDCR